MIYFCGVMASLAVVISVWDGIKTSMAIKNIERDLNIIYKHIIGREDEE